MGKDAFYRLLLRPGKTGGLHKKRCILIISFYADRFLPVTLPRLSNTGLTGHFFTNILSIKKVLMKKTLFFAYGVVSYFAFFGTILYAIGFVGNLLVPKGIDGTPEVPLLQAILTNAAFLLLFAVQHSVMARPAFKRWWTQFVPEPVERSTYVLLASIILSSMMAFWQPMGGIVWQVENEAVRTILMVFYLSGWAIVFLATFLINHFDLFGLRQVWLYFQGKKYTQLPFRTPFLYKYVRHPLYMGFLIAFWSAPVMTVTHLLFAVATTGYILIAIQFEERDLVAHFGDRYRSYRRQAPMLIPFTKKPVSMPVAEEMPSETGAKMLP